MIALILLVGFALAMVLLSVAAWWFTRSASLMQDIAIARENADYAKGIRARQLRDLDDDYAKKVATNRPPLTPVPSVSTLPGQGPKGAA